MIYTLSIKSISTIRQEPIAIPDAIKFVKLHVSGKNPEEAYAAADLIVYPFVANQIEDKIKKDETNKAKLRLINSVYLIHDITA